MTISSCEIVSCGPSHVHMHPPPPLPRRLTVCPSPQMDRVIKFLDGRMDEFTEELKGINPGVIARLEERAFGGHTAPPSHLPLTPSNPDRAPGVQPHLVFCLSLPPPPSFFPTGFSTQALQSWTRRPRSRPHP